MVFCPLFAVSYLLGSLHSHVVNIRVETLRCVIIYEFDTLVIDGMVGVHFI